MAMLVRRDGESLNAQLKRLDKAIGLAWSNDTFFDEVNHDGSDLLSSPPGSTVKWALRPCLQMSGSSRKCGCAVRCTDRSLAITQS